MIAGEAEISGKHPRKTAILERPPERPPEKAAVSGFSSCRMIYRENRKAASEAPERAAMLPIIEPAIIMDPLPVIGPAIRRIMDPLPVIGPTAEEYSGVAHI